MENNEENKPNGDPIPSNGENGQPENGQSNGDAPNNGGGDKPQSSNADEPNNENGEQQSSQPNGGEANNEEQKSGEQGETQENGEGGENNTGENQGTGEEGEGDPKTGDDDQEGSEWWYEDVETEVEEEIPEEEYEMLKKEYKENYPEDENDPPRTRMVTTIVQRKTNKPKPVVEEKEEEKVYGEDDCIYWMKDKIELDKFEEERHWTSDHNRVCNKFLTDPNEEKLFFWIETEETLLHSNKAPPLLNNNSFETEFVYFIKYVHEEAVINPENIQDYVSYGIVGPNELNYLLKIIKNEFISSYSTDSSWPENVKKEFISNLYKYMCQITEIAYKREGTTMLYIPNENLNDIATAIQDKDLMQRLEQTLLHWSKQIKDIFNNQESQNEGELADPLDEIKYWRTRQENLSFINKQLESAELKKILEVLKAYESNHVKNFEGNAKQINEGYRDAEENLKYLKSLQGPCLELEKARARDIPAILPQLLVRVRMISEQCAYYEHPERVATLLRKISNQIIKRCRDQINIKDLLEGNVEQCMIDLEDSIYCTVEWNKIYMKMEKMTHIYGQRKWNYGEGSSIFAQIDAFRQRCYDLKEICEGQLQFARKGSDAQMPIFGGTKGVEIINLLEENKVRFKKHLDKIKNTKEDKILDIKSTKWHDDYNAFKAGMRDLDNMYDTIINQAFESISTVEQGVEMLEAFDFLAKRRNIKASVQKKSHLVLSLFKKEVEKANAEYDSMAKKDKSEFVQLTHGKHSGMALWVRSLIHRLDKLKDAIDKLYFVDYSIKKPYLDKFDSVHHTLKHYYLQKQKFPEWRDEIKEHDVAGLENKLNQPLLHRAHEQIETFKTKNLEKYKLKKGQLESNFDKYLMRVIIETQGWEKIAGHTGLSIPAHVTEFVKGKKDQLRIHREFVMLVVREYNQILDDMEDANFNTDIKKLLQEHLEETNNVINHAVTRIKFSNKNVLEKTIRDCLRSCDKLSKTLKMFKENTTAIYEICNKISREKFIDLDKKHVMDLNTFERNQIKCGEKVKENLSLMFDEIRQILSKTYTHFYLQDREIQIVFFQYVAHIDHKIEESLKRGIKLSMVDLNKTINGDKKTNPTPIFKLSIVLDGVKVVFSPDTSELQKKINETLTGMTENVSKFQRMEVLMKEDRVKKIDELEKLDRERAEQDQRPGMKKNEIDYEARKHLPEEIESRTLTSFDVAIASDGDLPGLSKKILDGVQKTCSILPESLDPWKKHTSFFYTTSKEKFAEQMIDRKEPLSTLKSEIEAYATMQDKVLKDKSTENKACVQLDNSIIKNQIIDLVISWQNTMFNKIHEDASKQLNTLFTLFQNSAASLNPTPQDLHQLSKNKDSCDKLIAQLPLIEKELEPLEEKFKFLEKNNQVTISEEDQRKRETLFEEWENFNKMLERVQQRNAKKYAEFQAETLRTLDDFGKDCGEQRSAFDNNAPYTTNGVENERAFRDLNNYKEQVKALRKRENDMKFGFTLFNINPPPNADLDFVENRIDSLEKVWGLKEEWDKYRDTEIAKIRFQDFNLEELEDLVDEYFQKISQFSREMKAWEVCNYLRADLEKFRNTLPLIDSLRQPSMRKRHWNSLKVTLGKPDLDYEDENFCIGDLLSLNLLAQADSVFSITEVASAEFKIEVQLDEIEKAWESAELVIEPHKKEFIKMKKPDHIIELLEKNGMSLATMKTNAFFGSFEKQILGWESTLSNVSETLEILLQVQRQWIYLESIFASQQSEQFKQLVGDISKFKHLHQRFQDHLERIKNVKNALKSLSYEGFSMDLQDISARLEEIQKILLQLLELKRKEFPRFYFLSNDDLFELLGQAKDPKAVNKHIKKCFEGIKALDVETHQQPRSQKYHEIKAITSPDGEQVRFVRPVPVEMGVESWLKGVEDQMVQSLKNILDKVLAGIKKRDVKWINSWVHEWPGQLLILALQMRWTNECQQALFKYSDVPDRKKAWNFFKNEQSEVLKKLTELVRKSSNPVDRLKLVALITIEIHAQDVITYLYDHKIDSPQSFEWEKQLRFEEITETEAKNCKVKQTNTQFDHGFEYQGNNGRLVITPLTDRCYLTLTTAMHLQRGGAPQGPAGTGKTETVKDLGKGMGKLVMVFNCSEGLESKSIARMFSGLVQTGGWGCFDEFNRIEVEVLSVIATQISTIFNALRDGKTSFNFETDEIKCNPNVAIFVTMNPGYAGRSELPDNLKSLFRPVAMIVPDSELIAKNLLSAEGFKTPVLSKKIITLYDLMQQQLSKQDHYDFGLRAIKSVLTCAGSIRRKATASEAEKKDKEKGQPDVNIKEDEREETLILMKAIRDMNLPKFIAQDIPLFDALFNDLFKDEEQNEEEEGDLVYAVEDAMKDAGLQIHDPLVTKVIQLYDSIQTRHGNMLVGSTLAGKSTSWKILEKAMNALHKEQTGKWPGVKTFILNPKSVTINELYGYVDPNTAEWFTGCLASMMDMICKEKDEDDDDRKLFENSDLRWMILDGPVDTLWIESMNTVLDDNKVLTLLNGDRISLPPQVGLVFEVEDLSVASPATVSRCGMVYVDIQELGWRPYVYSWVDTKEDLELRDYLEECFDKWVPNILKAKRNCKDLVPCLDVNLVMSLCKFLDSLDNTEPGLKFKNPPKTDEYWQLLDRYFAFAVLWTLGGTVNEDGRKIIDYKFRDIESFFPVNSIYDYYINTEKGEFSPWEEKIPAAWKPPAKAPFHKLLVPTVDTVRHRYLLQSLVKSRKQILIVGTTGTGKTAIIDSMLSSLDDQYAHFYINFSAQTTSLKTQEIIESKLKYRSKTKMVPEANKKGIIFIDDLNMPRKEKFGAQPPLELLRQYIDYEGWYDRTNLDTFKQILEVQLVTAMGPPGGGRAEITQRVQSKFNVINFCFPSDTQVRRIFQSILGHHFLSQEFEEDIRPLAEPLAIATINLYHKIGEVFRATPAKAHYVFNLRDISKVIQGICQVDKYYCDTKESLLKLWCHEIMRIFGDRMTNNNDKQELIKMMSERLEAELQTTWKGVHGETTEETVFIDFFDETNTAYQEIPDMKSLKEVVEGKLAKYNELIRGAPMDIVLFNEAVINTCKINRILKLSRGHAMLIGDGGSGRHSLTKLAADIAGYKTFSIKIRKNYGLKDFREDLKIFCEDVGTRKKPGVFLFSDNEIAMESFVEDVNSLISTGEVPNLFAKDKQMEIREKVKKEAGSDNEDVIWNYFLNKVSSNLHVVFCMSKSGDNLRNYTRMYPGLVNNTTMIWFNQWPEEALFEVAERFIKELEFEDKVQKAVAKFFSVAHTSVIEYSDRMWAELKRLYYVTPTNYIELVKGYVSLLQEKRDEIGFEINKLATGLKRLEEAQEKAEELSKALDVAHNDLTQKQKDCEDLMIRTTQSSREADEKKKEVEAKTIVVEKEKAETQRLADEAQADLDKAMPALLSASEKIEKLTNKEFAEVRAYNKPPEQVEGVMAVILIFMGHTDTTWPNAKRILSEANFVNKIKEFSRDQKDNITTRTLNKVEKFTSMGTMGLGKVFNISQAAGCLWEWCLAMEKYAKAFRDIEPRRIKVKTLEEKLKKSEEELKHLQDSFLKLRQEIEDLNQQLAQAKADMEKFNNDAIELKSQLETAERLVYLLGSSKENWHRRKKNLEEQFENLIGDALVSAAFLSYAGPFPAEYRKKLVGEVLMNQVKVAQLKHTKKYSFSSFLAKQADVQEWNHQGLPTDQFSIENGVLVTKGRRWPLMIDPQLQANKWIKKMCEKEKLVIIDPQDGNYMSLIENAIVHGKPVLLQNITEDIDPSVEPVLNKATKLVGGRLSFIMGEKDIAYNTNFRFYLTTKFSNPKYKAEVTTKVTLVNFAVKEDGLEEQLLGELIKIQEATLEETKNKYVKQAAENEAILKQLDDDILKRLQEAKGSLVKDEGLLLKLQESKDKEDSIKQSNETIANSIKKTMAMRENYRELGARASVLFFALSDLYKIDNMYQFSLESYMALFADSVKNRSKANIADSLQDKLDGIDKAHRENVYSYACRGLFEKDKLLFAVQMTVKLHEMKNKKIAEKEKEKEKEKEEKKERRRRAGDDDEQEEEKEGIDMDEYNFFLRGATQVDRSQQPPNPAPDWINPQAWDQIVELDKTLPLFQNIVGSFMHNTKEWNRWFKSPKPEADILPGDWQNKCQSLEMMVLIRCLRPDRITFACKEFVSKKLGPEFVRPPTLNFESVFTKSKAYEPIIIILSPGVDPYPQIENLSQKKDQSLVQLSLGQGQTTRAKEKIIEGVKSERWVFLANCHLSIGFLAELEKLLDGLKIDPESKFRLWLTTNPHPKFPISLLQRSLKVTTEPPKGIKANMMRMIHQMAEEGPTPMDQNRPYKKLLWCLCWFHSIIIERRRFKSLGWNVMYDFNDSDFIICKDILIQRLEKSTLKTGQDASKVIPWNAIEYLIAEANYGGRVTDQCDRDLLLVYAKQFFNEKVITDDRYKLGEPNYIVPDDEGWKFNPEINKAMQGAPELMQFYYDKVKDFDDVDPPEAFGQHVNAQISSQIADSNLLLEGILALQPQLVSGGSGGEQSAESDLSAKVRELLEGRVPEPLEMMTIQEKTKAIPNDDPLKIILFQEIARYNHLLKLVRGSLEKLEKGLKGEILISEDLEMIMDSMGQNKVPSSWKFAYHSLKSFNSWIEDLNKRVNFMKDWAYKGQPNVFWISGFTFPTGFTTAVQQISARKIGESIDKFTWTYSFYGFDNMPKAPPDGAYVTGLFLEGAKWDASNNKLVEPETMKLHYAMPVIHFKPTIGGDEKKSKKTVTYYKCPCYMYPIRTAPRERPSFMFYVNLPCHDNQNAYFWIKRGTALLMSLQD